MKIRLPVVWRKNFFYTFDITLIYPYQIAPDKRGCKAYKLVYLVSVQMDVFWRFKTDFDSNFLLENKYIQEHHFIARNGNKVIIK